MMQVMKDYFIKMTLILTQNTEDCTNLVIDWFLYNSHKYIRINTENLIQEIDISISSESDEFCLSFSNLPELNINEISGIWFRKGEIILDIDPYLKDNNLKNHLQYLSNEWNTVANYFYNIILQKSNTSCIGINDQLKSNKLISLHKAQKAGLKIPETIITSRKKNIDSFLLQKEKLIIKGIQEVITFKENGIIYGTFTEGISNTSFIRNDINFPSCFQEQIEKKADLRIFYLKKQTYTTAIFNTTDTVDYRKNYHLNQRAVPFKLPNQIEDRLIVFMEEMGLDTGSIDMIYTKNKEFVFIEVNPFGQYSGYSYDCNYNLEKAIAETLMTNSLTPIQY
jgi:ATP-GRASP peptide maturase of grasp-with-spasm system